MRTIVPKAAEVAASAATSLILPVRSSVFQPQLAWQAQAVCHSHPPSKTNSIPSSSKADCIQLPSKAGSIPSLSKTASIPSRRGVC